MPTKMKFKIIIDSIMSILLIMLMSLQVTGQALHEYFGATLFILLIIHNILNFAWYRNIFRGKYTVMRLINTINKFLLSIDMILLMISGIMMSQYVFSFVNIDSGMYEARLVHLCAAYWGFVLMSCHVGLHWNMIIAAFSKDFKNNKDGILVQNKSLSRVIIWFCRILSIIIAIFGIIAFFLNKIPTYMFLLDKYAFLDYDKNPFLVFAENIAIMGLWIFIVYYISFFARRHKQKMSISK